MGWTDFGARMYNPTTGRWNGVDALAEKYAGIGGYVYVAGNPVLMVDVDGREIWVILEDGKTKVQYKDGKFWTTDNKEYDLQNSKSEFAKDVMEMFTYLKENQVDGIINEIANDKNFEVGIKKGYAMAKGTIYDLKSQEIPYDPQYGLEVYMSDDQSGSYQIQSPALGLLHEFGHAYLDKKYKSIANQYGSKSNEAKEFKKAYLGGMKEEEHVVQTYEKPAAEKINKKLAEQYPDDYSKREGVRDKYLNTRYQVKTLNPSSTIPIDSH